MVSKPNKIISHDPSSQNGDSMGFQVVFPKVYSQWVVNPIGNFSWLFPWCLANASRRVELAGGVDQGRHEIHGAVELLRAGSTHKKLPQV